MATAERDYYEILGVGRGAPDEEIKRAFRTLARELHPDVSDAPDAERRFREAAEAYEVLSDPERRATYDRFGHAGLRRGGWTPGDVGDLGDLFAAFFGDGLFGGRLRTRPARGADVTAAIELSLAEAFTGVTAQVPLRVARGCGTCSGSGAAPGTAPVVCAACGGAGRVQRVSQSLLGQFVRSGPCPACDGQGQVIETPCPVCDGAGRTLAEQALEVDVPPGIHHGQRIRIRGEGHDGGPGAARGDAYVLVSVAEPEGLTRDGDDLVAVVRITITQAALGVTVEAPGPDGPHVLELEPGVQPGHVHVVRRAGMPSLEHSHRGDLRVHVEVLVPRRLSPDQRAQVLALEQALGDEPYRERDDGLFGRLRSAFR